jgi:acyl-CoA thioester hydrolase
MNFNWPVRVYYEDTDSGGVVYYANYLKYMERARSEFLRHLGFEQDQLIAQQNIIFAVRSVQLDYKSPARFNDELSVTADLIELKKASMLFEQKIFRLHQADKILCQGQIRIACLQADSFKPCAIPQNIMEVAGVD